MSYDGRMEVHDITFIRDEGTIHVWEGVTDDGEIVSFGVDHRLSNDLPEGVTAEVEGWQILRVRA